MEGEKHWWVHTGSGNIWLAKCRTRNYSWFLGHWKREPAPSLSTAHREPGVPSAPATRGWGYT